jgi:hypothetical protein
LRALTQTQELVMDKTFKTLMKQCPEGESHDVFLHKEVHRLIPELIGFWIMKVAGCTCGCNESANRM